MTFQDAIRTCYNKYADFNGTASRPEYWWFFLYNVLGSLALMVLSFKLAMLFSLANLLPSLAVAARRLQDTGRSPLLLLIALVPFVGGIVLLVLLALPGESDAVKAGQAASAK